MENSMKEVKKVRGVQQPPGTVLYKVKDSDTLTCIAAQCDVSVSVLKKLNRLMLDTVFPDQVLYIPGPDFASFASAIITPTSPTEKVPRESLSSEKSSSQVKSPTTATHQAELSTSPIKSKPGHAERQADAVAARRPVAPPRALSEEEVKKIDEECHERFVKMDASYISPGDEEVPGVLLVTPDGIMFDADEQHPLILNYSRVDYQLVESIMSIVSVEVYHGISTAKYTRVNVKPRQTEKPIPINSNIKVTMKTTEELDIKEDHFTARSPATKSPATIGFTQKPDTAEGLMEEMGAVDGTVSNETKDEAEMSRDELGLFLMDEEEGAVHNAHETNQTKKKKVPTATLR